jgi:urease accessory protein
VKPEAFLAAAQLADGALPIGRFAHSYGLEAILRSEPDLRRDELEELLESLVLDGVAPLDAAALARAHDLARHGDLDGLRALDRRVTARKLTPGARQASTACGRNLAVLVPRLTVSEPAVSFAALVRSSDADGNLAVLEGALASALEIPRTEAVLLELRGVAAAFLSAAVRLGVLPAIAAQELLHRLGPTLVAAAARAEELPVERLRSVTPELDVYVVAHQRADARAFVT